MTQLDLFSQLPQDDDGDGEPPVLSVSQLTEQVKELLGTAFAHVWVTGEVSDFACPRSGHCYFTLKDDTAQIRAVMWRTLAQHLKFDLRDGLEIVCQGYIDVYAPRGSYQLIVQQVEPKGVGALELAFRQLHARLSAEGLFDPARKRPIPRFPRRIAVVTSPTGAAIRDFLEVLRRRWPGVAVLVIPARVQGEGAGAELAEAVRLANRLSPAPDVLVVTRGGGRMEDLWAFNDERLIRAIHASRVPVVSAVGHEIDVTLSDLVADVRALTPSEAAERVVPSRDELCSAVGVLATRLRRGLIGRAQELRAALETLAHRPVFRRPFDRIHDLARRLDELSGRLNRTAYQRIAHSRQSAEHLAAQLDALSPLSVLSRGYSLTQRPDGSLITSADQVQPGDELRIRLAEGRVRARVEECDTSPDHLRL